MTDDQDGSDGMSPTDAAHRWDAKAMQNIARWGLQDVPTLLLAMMEELGEIAQAYLESTYEDGDYDRVRQELDDLGALCLQLQIRLQLNYQSGDD